MPTEKTSLSLDSTLKSYAEEHGWNLSEVWNDAARRRKAREEQAVGVVYTSADRHDRMTRAMAAIRSAYIVRGGETEDDLEHRINADYIAKHQAKLMGELWPDVEFNARDLHITARRELKLPPLPTDQKTEEAKT